MDASHKGAPRTAGTGRGGCIFVHSPPSLPREARRRALQVHRIGRCSLFRFTDFIRQFRAGCTHRREGREPIRTVPPLRVISDIAGQPPRSAPLRCRLVVLWQAPAYVWTDHPLPRRRGATVVLACQAGARRARRASGLGARAGRSRGPARGRAARGCAARHAWTVTRGCQAPADPRRAAGKNTDRPRQCPPRRQRFQGKGQTMPALTPVAPPVARWRLSPRRSGWRAAPTGRGLGRVLGCPRHGLAADPTTVAAIHTTLRVKAVHRLWWRYVCVLIPELL